MKDVNNYKNYRTKYKRYYGIDFDKDFVVHHIDGDRSNNNIENLLLLPLDLHSKYHTYKTQFLSNTNGKIELGLSYGQAMKRRIDLYYFDDLIPTLQIIDYWIEQKQLADQGYKEAYRMFKKECI